MEKLCILLVLITQAYHQARFKEDKVPNMSNQPLLYTFFWVWFQTPGNYPEGNTHHSKHGESLKSRIISHCPPDGCTHLLKTYCLIQVQEISNQWQITTNI